MKKKLKLNDLQVKSFVTEANASQIRGGGPEETLYSCLEYISCDIVGCVATKYGNQCYTGGTVQNTLLCVN